MLGVHQPRSKFQANTCPEGGSNWHSLVRQNGAVPYSHILGQVLVIEDDPEQSNLLCRTIAQTFPGVNVLACDNAELALDTAVKSAEVPCPPDACLHFVLVDAANARLDLGDFIQRFRSAPRLTQVPIVGFSSRPGEEPLDGLVRAGLSSFVERPQDPAEMARALQEICRYWITVNAGLRSVKRQR